MHLSLENENQLTDQTMEKLHLAAHNQNTVWLNHANWCSHCIKFRPEWAKLRKNMKDKKINTVSLESTVIDKLKAKDSVLYQRIIGDKGLYFPMIIFFEKKTENAKSDKKHYELPDRDAKSISEFVETVQDNSKSSKPKPRPKSAPVKKQAKAITIKRPTSAKGGNIESQVQKLIQKFFKL
jgi:hypothetical protein